MRYRFLCLVALAGSLLMTALGTPAPAGRAKPETHKVQVTSGTPTFAFDPSDLTIATGDKVVWTNPTSAEHHIQPYAGPWAEGTHLHLDADGGKASLRFTKAGEYRYYCDIRFHGQLLAGQVCLGQCGTITVE